VAVGSAFVHPEFIVETEWLARALNDPTVRVLDCTQHLIPRPGNVRNDIKPGLGDFEQGHIPGASFVDIERDISDHGDPNLHFTLPRPDRFAQAMGRLGIGDDTMVVLYSTANHWWATRVWWMLRVFGHDRAAVLNGGFQKWTRESLPVEAGPGRPRRPAIYTPRFRPGYVADKEAVLAAIGANEVCIINALRPEQHAGTGGTSYGRIGHITGSINVAAVNLVDQDNVFKSTAELQRIFADALAKPRVITYCGGGIAASSPAMILTMLGHRDVQLYDASLAEWAADASLPMQV
jgi:thiosulfate/3-mercaptopyruvate sulfurtransferase